MNRAIEISPRVFSNKKLKIGTRDHSHQLATRHTIHKATENNQSKKLNYYIKFIPQHIANKHRAEHNDGLCLANPFKFVALNKGTVSTHNKVNIYEK